MFSRTFLSVGSRIYAKSNLTAQKVTCHRLLHYACKNVDKHRHWSHAYLLSVNTRIPCTTFFRYKSVSTSKPENTSAPDASKSDSPQSIDSEALDLNLQIPEPPEPSTVTEVIETIIQEPTLQSLGLGSNWPPGLIQKWLQLLHVSLDIPWWGTIAITTLCVRILILPIVIKMQGYTARMHNVQPQFQFLQLQLSDARKSGDQIEAARVSHEIHNFMKEKNISPLSNILLPLIQAPIFISFYYALRSMVRAPVDSMKEGGMLWFTDLTVPDPYYLLPVITCATLFLTIKTGADFVRTDSMGPIMRNVITVAPLIMFPFIMNFEAGILCYWATANFISLGQVYVFTIPKVRTYLNIPELIRHDKNKLPMAKKNFVDGFNDAVTNFKVAREIKSRAMYDETVFERSGRGPVPKTFKYDPTKRRDDPSPILAKKK
ncbi:hypothetical protein QAD02_019757 [Eretmocerus hayati]|uniref:Uncharacterized protein n=1 Tax=Eretmocerus hayati TaxID=131215 RepID=A0ACC2PK52_9HYME|nr:hypothetical protein QAD02_019757 [Eretmocerus hayati]